MLNGRKPAKFSIRIALCGDRKQFNIMMLALKYPDSECYLDNPQKLTKERAIIDSNV